MPKLPKRTFFPRLWSLAWPLILANISVPLLGIIDTAILGHLDQPGYLAAVAIGASLTAIILSGANFLRMGTTALAARARSKGNALERHQLFKACLYLAIILGIIVIITSPTISHHILTLFISGNETDLLPLIQEYIQVRLLSAPATFVNFIIVGWAIAEQKTKIALISLTTTAFGNIFLDILLIQILNYNSLGAAIASVLAEYFSLLITCKLFKRQLPDLFDQSFLSLPSREKIQELLLLNSDLFLRSTSLLFCLAWFNKQSAVLGVDTVAANAILLQIIALQSYALDGFANATEALVGKYSQKKQLQRIIRESLIFSFVAAAAICLMLSVSKPFILSLFTHQANIKAIADEMLWLVLLLPLISVFSYWMDGVAIGLSATRAMRNSILVSVFLIFIPACYLLKGFDNLGLWLSFYAFILARNLTLGPFLLTRRTHV